MNISIEVNGEAFENFTSASAQISLDSLSGSFSFDAVSTDGQILPFENGDACRILIDGEPVIVGFIEKLSYSYASQDHTISIQGRDKTADLIDSTMTGLKLSPPISLKQAIEAVLKNIGVTDIEVIEGVETENFNQAEEKLSASVGQNAFDFCETLARKRQVLLTKDSNGNIFITNGSGFESNAAVQNLIDSNNNNILSASVSYDLTGRFNKYIVKSQLNPVAANFAGDVPVKQMTTQQGEAIDENVRTGRQLVVKAENASSNGQSVKRATWSANVRKARGRVYSCEVEGFRNSDGVLYWFNQLIQVVDEFAEINAKMLVNSVEFSFSVSDGATTTLSFVDSNAYTLELTEPQVEKIGAASKPVFDASRLNKK
jgi:prophage tail gpP-like protein